MAAFASPLSAVNAAIDAHVPVGNEAYEQADYTILAGAQCQYVALIAVVGGGGKA